MFDTIDTDALAHVSGGFAGNTGITGGIPGVPNNKVPPMQTGRGYNTGITGGIAGVPNNHVPAPTHSDGLWSFDPWLSRSLDALLPRR